jgi:flagellar basal body-associated protein FliL
MNWHSLHPVVKILIGCILCLMIGGGIGYMRYMFSEWLDKREVGKKKKAQEPIKAVRKIYKKNGEWYIQ